MKKLINVLIIALLFLGTTGCKNINEASFKILSSPSEADVYINGGLKGKTPLTITLPYGNYEIEIKKENYEVEKRELTVNRKTKDINIALSEKKRCDVVLNIQESPLLKSPYSVYLDGHFTGEVTECTLKNIPKGTHTIKLVSLEDIREKTINLTGDITLSRQDFDRAISYGNYSWLSSLMDIEDYSEQYTKEMKWIVFNDDKPLVDVCCSPAATAYSNIFVNETVNVSGYIEKEATIDNFNIVFPSGKKVHFDTTEKNGYRVFSKKVTFDEVGKYTIGKGSPFEVLYKATPLPPAKTTYELFGERGDTVAIPENTEETIRLFITDANGNPVINKSIGMYGAKTDSHGIVTLKVKGECGFGGITVNGENVGVRLYGGLIGWVYHTTTLYKKDVDIKYINGDVYIPKALVLGYFSNEFIKDTQILDGKEYADLETLKGGGPIGGGSIESGPILVCSVIITDDAIEFLKMCDMVP